MSAFSSTDDVIDVRDVIARVEELRDERDEYENPEGDLEAHDAHLAAADELAKLESLLSDLAGYGGDEQWEGDWYPVALIRDSYFTDYARELLEDCGDIPRDLPHYIAIDWDATAKNIQVDYSSVEFDGVTYWYR